MTSAPVNGETGIKASRRRKEGASAASTLDGPSLPPSLVDSGWVALSEASRDRLWAVVLKRLAERPELARVAAVRRARTVVPSFFPNRVFVEFVVTLHEGFDAIVDFAINDAEEHLMLPEPMNRSKLSRERFPLALDTIEQARDYVRFYFRLAIGKHGRFLIVEAADQMPWHKAPPKARRPMNSFDFSLRDERARAAEFEKRFGAPFQWAFNGVIAFKDSVFRSMILIERNNRLMMCDEVELAEKLPVTVERVDGVLRYLEPYVASPEEPAANAPVNDP